MKEPLALKGNYTNSQQFILYFIGRVSGLFGVILLHPASMKYHHYLSY